MIILMVIVCLTISMKSLLVSLLPLVLLFVISVYLTLLPWWKHLFSIWFWRPCNCKTHFLDITWFKGYTELKGILIYNSYRLTNVSDLYSSLPLLQFHLQLKLLNIYTEREMKYHCCVNYFDIYVHIGICKFHFKRNIDIVFLLFFFIPLKIRNHLK